MQTEIDTNRHTIQTESDMENLVGEKGKNLTKNVTMNLLCINNTLWHFKNT